MVLAIFFLFRAVELNRLRDWCLIGAALGVGMLCKYSIGILVVSMVLYLCWERKCRHFWLTPGPWLTTLTAFLIFSPHLYWLVQNDFPPFQFAASVLKTERNPWNHMLMPLYFAGSQLLLILPILISLIPLCGCVWQLRRETSVTLKPAEGPETDMEETAFRKRFLNFMFWFPIIFQFAIFAYSGSECIRPQYGSALWTLTALWYSQYFRNFPTSRSFLRTARLPLAVLLCFVIVYWADLHFRYCFTDRPARWHFPCEGIAAALDHAWSEKYPGTACPILTGDWKVAGPASLKMKERPTVLFYYHGLEEGMRPHGFWISDEDFAEKGGIVVWKVEDGLPSNGVPEYLKRRFPTAEPATEVLTIPWQTSAKVKPLKIRYAIAPPAEKKVLK